MWEQTVHWLQWYPWKQTSSHKTILKYTLQQQVGHIFRNTYIYNITGNRRNPKCYRYIKKNCCWGNFMIKKTAFNTINHEILIIKLERCGKLGIVLDGGQGYLSGAVSSCLDIAYGVHQESVLSSIYIILLLKSSELLRFELFADDTNITERHHHRNKPTKMMVRHNLIIWGLATKTTGKNKK